MADSRPPTHRSVLLSLLLALSISACQATPAPTPTATAVPVPTQAPPTLPPAATAAPPATSAPTVIAATAAAPVTVRTVEVNGSTLLDPASIPQFVEPLVIPPVMPSEGRRDWEGTGEPATEYHIAARQFQQQILPSGFPQTTVWGYGRAGDPLPRPGVQTTFNSPAFTVEARSNERVRVVWMNQLVDDPAGPTPHYLPHLLPVDPTLHWANPTMPDSHGMGDQRYDGPVPMVTHVHGAHVTPESDGYPDAWYLPDAADIPAGFKTQGSHYASVHPAPPGVAVFEYANDQRAMTLWYHDHSLGITRLNVYAGLAGFWILRDDVEDALDLPGPAPRAGDAPGTPYYEMPIVIQDRSFKPDGSLFYPDSRKFFGDYDGEYGMTTQVPPIWNPEFFGNTMMVNGRTWPYLEVEPRLYRFRLLNGADARFLLLKFDQNLAFHQIGNEGGLLPDRPLEAEALLMAPAERADVIVDFSKFKPGDTITLLNLGPDEPFSELPVDPAVQADPATTGKVMQFRVVPLTDQGNPGRIPDALPAIAPLTTDLPPRDLTLHEKAKMPEDVPIEAQLGDGDSPEDWATDITETPVAGTTEIWRITNLTPDAHPIHPHLVHFQVLDRTPIDVEAYQEALAEYVAGGSSGTPPDPMQFANGLARPPAPWEAGWKETVIASPGMVTRFIANFDIPGLFVWHCHILEHEDNEMMRPYVVRAAP